MYDVTVRQDNDATYPKTLDELFPYSWESPPPDPAWPCPASYRGLAQHDMGFVARRSTFTPGPVWVLEYRFCRRCRVRFV